METGSTSGGMASRQSSNEIQREDEQSVESDETTPPRWLLCWYVLSWCFAILTYVAEGFAVVWVAIHYANFDLYPNLALTIVCYFVASMVNSSISLFWYYDMDRTCRSQLEASGPFPGRYKRKCTFAAITIHCLMLGEVYR